MKDSKAIVPVVIPVMLFFIVSTATVGLPVATSIADVPPDHPFYFMKEFGETLRGMSPEQKMEIRWREYVYVVRENKAEKYEHVFKRFITLFNQVCSDNELAKERVRVWIENHYEEIGEVQLHVVRQYAKIEIENQLREWKESKSIENLRAWIQVVKENVPRLAVIDNLFDNLCTKIIIQIVLLENWNWDKLWELYENLKTRGKTLLENAPDTPIKVSALKLHQLAVMEGMCAREFYETGFYDRAFGMLVSAIRHLRDAEIILEKAHIWEQLRFRPL